MMHTNEEVLLVNKTFILLPALYSVMQASVSTKRKHLNTSMIHIGEEILLVNKTF